MTTSFFITLDKPIYIGANKYSYKDQIVYEDESVQKQCKNKKEFYNNICNKNIACMYVEGQKKGKMDPAIKQGMYIFVRVKSSDFVFIGNIETVEMIRENTMFSPALYRIYLDTTDPDVRKIMKPNEKNKGIKGASKLAAFEHLGLPIPVVFRTDVGIYDHDPEYKSKNYPQKKYMKPQMILTTLEERMKFLSKEYPEIYTCFQLYSNIAKSNKYYI